MTNSQKGFFGTLLVAAGFATLAHNLENPTWLDYLAMALFGVGFILLMTGGASER